MKRRWDKKYIYAGITAFGVIVASVFLVFLFINWSTVSAIVGTINKAMTPIYIGLIIAFILNPLVKKLENGIQKVWHKAFPKKKEAKAGVIRAISVTVVILFAIAVIIGLLMLVIPEMYSSIEGLVNDMPKYFTNFKDWAAETMKNHKDLEEKVITYSNELYLTTMKWLSTDVIPNSTAILLNVSNGVFSVISAMVNIIIGIIVSIYLMISREHFAAQAKKSLYCLFPVKSANQLLHALRYTSHVFGKFISGKVIDSLIVGIICFIGLSLLGIPYALLISVIVGVTNVIPFFGVYLGAIPSIFLILLSDPGKFLPFIIFFIILMQFDANIMGPLILGDSIGLSSFWILFSILVFGNIFGLLGMICAVPVFAVVYALISQWTRQGLKHKKLPEDTMSYEKMVSIDKETLTPNYAKDKNENKILP